ncbi:MAG: hypothetical protein OT477_16870 [Chloroflexi bacterium]|nr:hypothetical protein [Chloroflexota bacterium]
MSKQQKQFGIISTIYANMTKLVIGLFALAMVTIGCYSVSAPSQFCDTEYPFSFSYPQNLYLDTTIGVVIGDNKDFFININAEKTLLNQVTDEKFSTFLLERSNARNDAYIQEVTHWGDQTVLSIFYLTQPSKLEIERNLFVKQQNLAFIMDGYVVHLFVFQRAGQSIDVTPVIGQIINDFRVGEQSCTKIEE